MNTVLAQCPKCKGSFLVVIGRKATTREAACECGERYYYSAWKLKTPRSDGETVSLRTFYQVDLFSQAPRVRYEEPRVLRGRNGGIP